jgi:putative oxidoreductase
MWRFVTTGNIPMQKFVPVIARLLLAQLFLLATVFQVIAITSHPDGYTAYQVYLGQFGLPGIFAPLTLLIQFAGGMLLLLGYKARAAAYVMTGYALFVAFFLKLGEPIIFMQYLAIAGGMLALAGSAPTACSLDNLRSGK